MEAARFFHGVSHRSRYNVPTKKKEGALPFHFSDVGGGWIYIDTCNNELRASEREEEEKGGRAQVERFFLHILYCDEIYGERG